MGDSLERFMEFRVGPAWDHPSRLEVTYVERLPAWCAILALLVARDSPPIAKTAHLVDQAFEGKER